MALDACHKCNRPLKNQRSRERGLGPKCWREVNSLPAPKKRVAAAPVVEYDPDQYLLFEDINVCGINSTKEE